MSRKGTPADNACIEWFHSVLKSETFYLHNWRNLNRDSITDIVKNYITFYNETRIQRNLKDMSPVEYLKPVLQSCFSSVPLTRGSPQIRESLFFLTKNFSQALFLPFPVFFWVKGFADYGCVIKFDDTTFLWGIWKG